MINSRNRLTCVRRIITLVMILAFLPTNTLQADPRKAPETSTLAPPSEAKSGYQGAKTAAMALSEALFKRKLSAVCLQVAEEVRGRRSIPAAFSGALARWEKGEFDPDDIYDFGRLIHILAASDPSRNNVRDSVNVLLKNDHFRSVFADWKMAIDRCAPMTMRIAGDLDSIRAVFESGRPLNQVFDDLHAHFTKSTTYASKMRERISDVRSKKSAILPLDAERDQARIRSARAALVWLLHKNGLTAIAEDLKHMPWEIGKVVYAAPWDYDKLSRSLKEAARIRIVDGKVIVGEHCDLSNPYVLKLNAAEAAEALLRAQGKGEREVQQTVNRICGKRLRDRDVRKSGEIFREKLARKYVEDRNRAAQPYVDFRLIYDIIRREPHWNDARFDMLVQLSGCEHLSVPSITKWELCKELQIDGYRDFIGMVKAFQNADLTDTNTECLKGVLLKQIDKPAVRAVLPTILMQRYVACEDDGERRRFLRSLISFAHENPSGHLQDVILRFMASMSSREEVSPMELFVSLGEKERLEWEQALGVDRLNVYGDNYWAVYTDVYRKLLSRHGVLLCGVIYDVQRATFPAFIPFSRLLWYQRVMNNLPQEFSDIRHPSGLPLKGFMTVSDMSGGRYTHAVNIVQHNDRDRRIFKDYRGKLPDEQELWMTSIQRHEFAHAVSFSNFSNEAWMWLLRNKGWRFLSESDKSVLRVVEIDGSLRWERKYQDGSVAILEPHAFPIIELRENVFDTAVGQTYNRVTDGYTLMSRARIMPREFSPDSYPQLSPEERRLFEDFMRYYRSGDSGYVGYVELNPAEEVSVNFEFLCKPAYLERYLDGRRRAREEAWKKERPGEPVPSSLHEPDQRAVSWIKGYFFMGYAGKGVFDRVRSLLGTLHLPALSALFARTLRETLQWLYRAFGVSLCREYYLDDEERFKSRPIDPAEYFDNEFVRFQEKQPIGRQLPVRNHAETNKQLRQLEEELGVRMRGHAIDRMYDELPAVLTDYYQKHDIESVLFKEALLEQALRTIERAKSERGLLDALRLRAQLAQALAGYGSKNRSAELKFFRNLLEETRTGRINLSRFLESGEGAEDRWVSWMHRLASRSINKSSNAIMKEMRDVIDSVPQSSPDIVAIGKMLQKYIPVPPVTGQNVAKPYQIESEVRGAAIIRTYQ